MGFFDSLFSNKERVDKEMEANLGWPTMLDALNDEVRTIAVVSSRLHFTDEQWKSPSLLREAQQRHLELVFKMTRLNKGGIHVISQDSVVCIYNLWLDLNDPAVCALKTGIGVFQNGPVAFQFNGSTVQVEFGIGIDYGTALRASVGDTQRKSQTAFGFPVRVAEELSRMKPGRIRTTKETAAVARSAFSDKEWQTIETVSRTAAGL